MYSDTQDSNGTPYPAGAEMKKLSIKAINDNFRKLKT